ncbi:MAG: tRNA (N(6)-L-threonylcarbamoyladenosine(37)-C(2))-methylthiotransferase MtaB [Candidatus Eisenbacteria bacterium]|nr:tRNA (N(6)-L-threonylcarbamoyladenosine(37)-C(2))-methylthiotransferase MtaB [Candidatus Eisenbacteria bacterium]MCC7144211.1 tRNA (N(6)-L-threonylcarbamoyladenosine(37)-C(2))-methylthiotransferase MtaB [Candidatus Eisenbacteria bacterium]
MPELETSQEAPLRREPRSPRGRISFASIGCKANQEEMECLVSRLADAGYVVVPFGAPADWTVVNTCTVTGAGDSDSRQAVRRAARLNPEGRLIVTGCLAQRDPATLAALPGVDWVVGNGEKPYLAQYILDAEPERRAARVLVGADPTVKAFPDYGAARDGRRTRATLKVQDGCDEHCTFCVIPEVRGRSRSRPLDDVLRQAERLVASGYREVMLTGINTALWGADADGPRELGELLFALAEVPGLARIRLNSLEPQLVTDRWLELMARSRRVCQHLHLPLQSGDDRVLRRMNRRYSCADYAALVARVRAWMPDCAIGADLLVGFPGETEAQFEETCRFVEEQRLAYLHVFSYSPRPGTAAPKLGAEVPAAEKARRSARLRAVGVRLRAQFAQSQLGSRQQILVEAPSGGDGWQGLTGNYLRVRFSDPRTALGGTMVEVRLESLDPRGMIRGQVIAGDATSPASEERV